MQFGESFNFSTKTQYFASSWLSKLIIFHFLKIYFPLIDVGIWFVVIFGLILNTSKYFW